jgi:hypothetical protein
MNFSDGLIEVADPIVKSTPRAPLRRRSQLRVPA